MSIREKRTSISQFAAALRQRSSQDKRDLLVADTLDSLCRHCDLYDAARVSSNPFHPELLRAIAAADFSPDALFSLFECLAVLVHLRKLAHPAIPLDDAEEELLFQFEHSGEWLPDDLPGSALVLACAGCPPGQLAPCPPPAILHLPKPPARVVFLWRRAPCTPEDGMKKARRSGLFSQGCSRSATGHGQ